MCVHRAWKAVLVLIFLLAPGGLQAGEEQESLRQEVEALQRRLEAQEAEMAKLREEQKKLLERLQAQESQTATVAPAPAAPAAIQEESAASTETAYTNSDEPWWKNDKLHLGGYGSFRFETNSVGGNQFVPGGSASGFTFRRFVLTTDSRLNDRIHVYSETEFERLLEIEVEKRVTPTAGGLQFVQATEGNNGAEIALEQMWVEYDLGLGEKQAIRAGLVLPPLGRYNILHDDDYWDIPRRTLTDRDAPVSPVPTAWSELGVGWVGSTNLGSTAKLDYQVYLLGGSTLDFNIESIAQTRTPQRSKQELEVEMGLTSGAADGTRNAEALAWRVALSPSLAGEIAVSGYHGQYTPSFLTVDEPVNAFGLDGKWRFGQFEVEGEALYSSFGNTTAVARSFAQAALHSAVETSSGETAELENEIEIELAGLARTRYGFWVDAKYHWRPGWLRESFLGRGFEDPQLIPIVRYERVWLRGNIDELEFSDGLVTALAKSNLSQDRWTLGMNYRPVQQVGVQFAYEHNQRREGSELIFPRLPVKSTDGFLMGLTFGF